MKVERICAILERPEHIGYIGVFNRFARLIRNQILFRNISDIERLIVFCQQVVKRLILDGSAVLGDGLIPFFRVRKLWIDVKNHPSEGMFFMADHLSQTVFGVCLQHYLCPHWSYYLFPGRNAND